MLNESLGHIHIGPLQRTRELEEHGKNLERKASFTFQKQQC